jgi:hypothetical protein
LEHNAQADDNRVRQLYNLEKTLPKTEENGLIQMLVIEKNMLLKKNIKKINLKKK